MEWTDLLSSRGIIALVLVGVLFAVAMIVVLIRGKFRIKTVKVKSPLFPFEIETEPQKEQEEEEKKPTTAPRPTRTVQEAEAKDGGHLSKIEQSAPAGTASTQRVSAEGENSEASVIRQIIQ